jgi:hypothetical protein
LSQSLSDLRNGAVGATTPSRRKPKLHSSEGNIQKSKEEVEIEPEVNTFVCFLMRQKIENIFLCISV